jgi:hypothetical protein
MRIELKQTLGILLAAMLCTVSPLPSRAQSANRVGGRANGASVNVSANVLSVPAIVSVPAVAPVDLPSQGGSFNNQVASASAEVSPGVMPVLSTSLISNATTGTISQNGAHAESTSTVNNLNLLGGLITASTVRSKSTSDGNGTTASSSATGSFANQLRISGVLYEQSEFAPNTTVSVNATIAATVSGLQVLVPVTGNVIINEQIAGGNGITSSSLTVNFLHVSVSGSAGATISLNADIVIASALSSVTFSAGAEAGNHPPALTLPGPQTVQVGTTLEFGATATDPDSGDSVSLAASNLPAGSSVTPNPAQGNPAHSQLRFAPTQNQEGQSFLVNFTATDSHGAATGGSVSITVTGEQNRPPVISVPGPQVIKVGQTLNFTVTATDPDGDSVMLSATSVPINAQFNASSGQFTFTPSGEQAGQTPVVTFTAADSKGAAASATVQITVVNASGDTTNPGPPIISVPPSPILVPVGTTLVFTVVGTSPAAGCGVTISASGVPDHASFSPSDGRFRFSPTADQKDQSFVVTFTASDCIGQTATAGVTIIVIDGSVGAVGGPGHICVPVNKIFFGATTVDTNCGFIVLTVTNEGSGNLAINSLRLDNGTHFRIEGAGSSPLILKSAATLTIRIVFQPRATGTMLDTLTLVTSDPDRPTVTIALKGKGVNK